MSGKFITCLWRKKRLRRGFVLSHKDTSSDLAVGGRQHWGLGDPHMALSPSHACGLRIPPTLSRRPAAVLGQPGELGDHSTALTMLIPFPIPMSPARPPGRGAVGPRH